MADKGDVYYCTWEKNEDGDFVGWEIKRPSLRAEGMTASEMEELLCEVVGEYHNDNEAALQFDPPLSIEQSDNDLFKDGFVQVTWNSGFRFSACADTAFSEGRCPRCGGGLGDRTKVDLIVDVFDTRADGAFSSASNEPPAGDTWHMPASITIFSETFLKRLTARERSQFSKREVHPDRKRTLRYFELVPNKIVPIVAIKGRDCGGWRCDKCDRRVFSYAGELGWGTDVVCRTDLPLPMPPCFFVGTPDDFSLCISRKRFDKIRGMPGTRKLICNPLAVVEKSKCDRNPWLPTLDEVAKYRDKHGYHSPIPRPKRKSKK
jgi:hypothetical protein